MKNLVCAFTIFFCAAGAALGVQDVEQYRAEYQNEVRQLQEAHDMAARKLRRPDGTIDKASPEYQRIQQHYNTQKTALRNRFLANHPASKAWESLQQMPEGGKLSNTGSDPSSAPSDMDLSAADTATAKAAAKHLEGQGHKVTYDPELGMYLDHTTDTKIWEPGTPAQQKARASNPEGYTRSGSLEHEGISSPDAQYDPEGYVEDLNKKYEAAKKAGDTRTANKVARKMQEALGQKPDPVTQKMGVDADPYESGEASFGESDAVKKAKAAQRADAMDKQVQEARAKAKAQSESNARMRNDLANKETGLGNKKSANEYTDANQKIENTKPKSGSTEPVKAGGATDTAGGTGKGVGETTGTGKSGGSGGAVDTAGGTGKGVGETTGTGKSGGSGGAVDTAGGTGRGVGETTGTGKSGGSGGAVDTAGGTGKGVGETTGGRTSSGKGGGTGGAETGAGPSVGEGGVAEGGTGKSGSGAGEVGGGQKSGGGKSGSGAGVTDTASTGGKGVSVGESPTAGEGTGAGEPRVTETSGPKAGETGGPRVTETSGGPVGEPTGTGEPRVTETGRGPATGETGGPRVTETGAPKVGETGGPKTGEGGAPKSEGAAGAGGRGVAGKALDAAGTAMETAVVINQAGKVYDGLKKGDAKEAAAGIVGEDAAKTAEVQGGKDYSDAMGQLLDAKTAEAQSAAEGKLKRMGATPEELKTYSDNYNKNPAAARAVVQAVKDRGGVDTKPQKGLEGAGPEESSWNAGDQLTDGAKQAHGYVDTAAMGGLSHTENAVSDVFDITKSADAVDDSTKAEQLSKMYTDLRMRGATKDEANKALQDYYRNPKPFRDLVKDLHTRDPDKFDAAAGKHAKNLGGRGNVDVVADDTVGDRAAAVGQDLKHGLVDNPAKVVGNILGDITGDNQETEAILNQAGQRGKDAAAMRDQIYRDLIAKGVKEGEARDAVNGLARGDHTTLRTLVKGLGDKDKSAPTTDGATAKAGAGDKEAFGPKDPVTSDRSAFEGATAEGEGQAVTDTGEPVPWGARNDAGEAVDAGAYESGDKIINKDGKEFVNQDGQWVETGNDYGAYDAGADKGGNEAVSTPSIPDTGLDASGNPIAETGESPPPDQGEAVASDDQGETDSDESIQNDDEQEPDDTSDVADNSGPGDSEGEDGEVDNGDSDEGSSDDLADNEADMPDMEADEDDSDDEDEGGILDGYANDRDEDAGERGDAGLKTMGGVLQVAQASTAGDQQVADANQAISDAGEDFNTSRSQSSSAVAADDRANSWGTKMGDSIQSGLEQGLSAAAGAVGSAAADQVTGQIFDNGKPDSSSGGGSGGGGGDTCDSSGGGSSSGAAVSGGGGGGGGSVPPPPGGGAPSPPPPPPPGGGGGGAGALDCIKCYQCGAVFDKGNNPGYCPGCGFGQNRQNDLTFSGWCTPFNCAPPAPPASGNGMTCPKCGKPHERDLGFGWRSEDNGKTFRRYYYCSCGAEWPDGPALPPPPTPPPVTISAPAAPAAPKGWKCPVCGSYDTVFSNTHPLYGDVYHCNGCGGAVHNVY